MWKVFNYIFPIRDWLYILQLEEYELGRYWHQIRPRLLSSNFEQRDTLRFTSRVKVILFITVSLVAIAFLISWYVHTAVVLLLFLSLPFITPYLVGLASLFAQPLAYFLTLHNVSKTKTYWRTYYPKTRVIAITGSYGKTTTKYLLYDLLQHSYKCALVPENINTLLGIADFILAHKVPKNSEYLIIEIGAYIPGDISATAAMLEPDVSIITALGDQHLERFGSLDRLYTAKYELFAGTKPSGECYTTTAAADLLRTHQILEREIIEIQTTTSPADNQHLAVKVATDLGVSEAFITDALKKFTLPERRNSIYKVQDVTVIDNSYNISPQTAQAVIASAAAKAREYSKHLVVMTAGIPEQGERSEAVNSDFAKLLNDYASRIILHPSMYAPAITKSLTIPYSTQERAVSILEDITNHIDGTTEILLHLPEHSDLAYV